MSIPHYLADSDFMLGNLLPKSKKRQQGCWRSQGKYHTFTQSPLYLGTILVSRGFWGHTLDTSYCIVSSTETLYVKGGLG